MLAAPLVAAIRNPSRPESCPDRPKRESRVDATLAGTRELVDGEAAAKRMVAYALLGSLRG